MRRSLVRTGAGLACLAAAALFATAGLALCVWAGYQYLFAVLGPIPTAVAVGMLLLILAGVLAWTVTRLSR